MKQWVLLSLLLRMAALPLPASAEIVLLGAGRTVTVLGGGAKLVGYLKAGIVVGFGGSLGGRSAARIGLDRLLLVRREVDNDVDDTYGFGDAKEEVSLDKFGDERNYGGICVDDDYDGSSGSGVNSKNHHQGSQTHDGQGGGGGGPGAAVLDVAIFRVPSGCAYGPPARFLHMGNGGDLCDWPSLGVGTTVPDAVERDSGDGTAAAAASGTRTTTTTTYYCCHARAIQAGACANASQTKDRLILTDTFTGHHRAVAVPPGGGEWTANVTIDGTILLSEPGTWVVAFANCNGNDRMPVLLSGEVAFESSYGYLPAELLPYLVLAGAVYALCSLLFGGYLLSMVRNAASRIPVEKWILLTIALAGMEAALLVAGYAVWNRTGYQNYRLAVAAMVAGAFKSAVGRSVLLAAALGWGVTKESLRCLTAAGVVLLGAAAVPLELLIDLNQITAVRDERHQTFLGAVRGAAESAQDVVGRQNVAYLICAVWTVGSLGWTMWMLGRTRQARKLGRYLRLSAVLLLSSLGAAAVAAVAQLRMARDIRYALLPQKAEGAVFFLALAGVAILWRPNASAREYAYLTQLPSSEEEEDNAGEADDDDDDGADADGLAQEREADADADETKTTPGADDGTRTADDAIAADAPGEIELPRVM